MSTEELRRRMASRGYRLAETSDGGLRRGPDRRGRDRRNSGDRRGAVQTRRPARDLGSTDTEEIRGLTTQLRLLAGMAILLAIVSLAVALAGIVRPG
jgi:hypothetical protein